MTLERAVFTAGIILAMLIGFAIGAVSASDAWEKAVRKCEMHGGALLIQQDRRLCVPRGTNLL